MARAPIPYDPQPDMKFLGIPLHPVVSDMNGVERKVCYAWTFFKCPKCVKSAKQQTKKIFQVPAFPAQISFLVDLACTVP